MLTVYVGDICQGARLEKVFPKEYLFGLDVTEDLLIPRGVREESFVFPIIMLLLIHNVIFSRKFTFSCRCRLNYFY